MNDKMKRRVFFSRITLEDKLGQEYEPYIFAALNSAKVMLAFGTCYDYYNAVWVKNEWSRFLQLMELGQKKTHDLIVEVNVGSGQYYIYQFDSNSMMIGDKDLTEMYKVKKDGTYESISDIDDTLEPIKLFEDIEWE